MTTSWFESLQPDDACFLTLLCIVVIAYLIYVVRYVMGHFHD